MRLASHHQTSFVVEGQLGNTRFEGSGRLGRDLLGLQAGQPRYLPKQAAQCLLVGFWGHQFLAAKELQPHFLAGRLIVHQE